MRAFKRTVAAACLTFSVAAGLSACATNNDAPIFGDARHEPIIPFLPDTGSTNASRFGDETFPVFMRPGPTPKAMQPIGSGALGYSGGARLPLNQQDQVISRYGPVQDHGLLLPAIPVANVPPRFLRQEVPYKTSERPGSLVVDTRAHFLYFVLPHGKAIRYGISIGRQGYAWAGRGNIRYKKAWPRWTPTEGMVKSDPDLREISADRGGMVAGINNPLGARALYIFRHGKDTLYRVHGTPDWRSIGKNASSGCVRMFNQDVIDLYGRVKNGASILVM